MNYERSNRYEDIMKGIPENCFDPEAPIGQAVRFRHDSPDCSRGKDSCLIVTRTESGWKFYCHRCGAKGVRGLDGLPPDKMKKWYEAKKNVPKQTEKVVTLPRDFTLDLTKHPKAYAWLMTLGITDEQIRKFRIGYSRYFDRLIFPVYMDGKLVFWQGRTFNPITKENPKWLSVRVPRDQDVFFIAGGDPLPNTIVLVEDILSAIKLSTVCHAVALLGVYIPDKLMWRVKKSGLHAVIWLDQDKTDKSLWYCNRFRAAGIPTRVRSTTLDPKKYTTKQLKEILG
jgi:hypothetical protein